VAGQQAVRFGGDIDGRIERDGQDGGHGVLVSALGESGLIPIFNR